VIVVTTAEIEGKRITKVIGLAKGNTVRARHVGQDILAFLKNMIGGEINNYTKLLAESREQALDRMVADAEAMGANAVIMARFQTSMIMAGTAELLAYGTAVIIEDER
jgi:uncharacterized protein YbjQ (UPF0145 family)